MTETLKKQILECLEMGIENTRNLIAEHDIALGRTISKNRDYAEMLESEVAQMKETAKEVEKL